MVTSEKKSNYLVVFDCDGTISDSQKSIIDCMTLTFNKFGLVPPSPLDIKQIIGLNLNIAMNQLLPSGDVDLITELVKAYKENYIKEQSGKDPKVPLFPNARRTIIEMSARGWNLGIATGKSKRGLKATLEAHDIFKYFCTIQTSDTSESKPSPQMLYQAMSETDMQPDNTVMVGDTTFDMEMAQNAGIKSIGVSWGYHEVSDIMRSGAIVIVDEFSSIHSAVERLFI
ncbi:MAG: HAD-IA family hydrolase [Pseudomonadota bacterium]|nr:HAD-IA family hydrolase [Pseudomonadota bacterium]